MSNAADTPEPTQADAIPPVAAETPVPPTRSPEWWMTFSLKQAESAADRCITGLEEEIRSGASPRVAAARDAAIEAKEAIRDVGRFAGLVRAAVQNPGTTIPTVVAILLGAFGASLFLWPAKGGAGAQTAPTSLLPRVVTKDGAEERAMQLLEAGDYDGCQRVIDLEIAAPHCWYLRGEVERMKGNELLARVWYDRAAAAGHVVAARALTQAGRKE